MCQFDRTADDGAFVHLKQRARLEHRVGIGRNVAQQPHDPERPNPLHTTKVARQHLVAATLANRRTDGPGTRTPCAGNQTHFAGT